MKIAYFSPFPPERSGIADFSEELIPELSKYCEIDVFTDKKIESKVLEGKINIYPMSMIDDEDVRSQYDRLVYQVGNNWMFHKDIVETFLKYPDILEIHDLAMHHYLAEDTYVAKDYDKYIEIMEYCHGEDGARTARRFLKGEIPAPWDHQSEKYTVNKYLVDAAKSVIVHSDLAYQSIRGIRLDVPIVNIPLHTTEIIDEYEAYKLECKTQIGLENTIVMGSFGYATRAKRIEQILEALGQYKNTTNKKFVYCIVGTVKDINIDELLVKWNLKDNVIVTGYTELAEFKTYMGACDFCFNLLYPTQGESSASLHRLLGMGKPIVVTNIGSFEEYPNDVVLKVRYDKNEIDDILNCLFKLSNSEGELSERSKKAYLFAKEKCDLGRNAQKYVHFFGDKRVEDDYSNRILDVLQEVNLFDNSYLESISDTLAELFD